jgi:hypothetical protein
LDKEKMSKTTGLALAIIAGGRNATAKDEHHETSSLIWHKQWHTVLGQLELVCGTGTGIVFQALYIGVSTADPSQSQFQVDRILAEF